MLQPMSSGGFLDRSKCPGCSGRQINTLYASAYREAPVWDFVVNYYPATKERAALFDGVDYHLSCCVACGLIFQRWIPNGLLMEELYDHWLNASYHPDADSEYQANVRNPARSRDGHELLTFSSWSGRRLSSLRVMDFGMGWGLWARVALGMGCTTFGYDVSKQRCEDAQGHGVQITDLDSLSGLELDFINAEQVFEHLPNPSQDLTRLAKGLRRGGVIKIAVPNGEDIRRRIRVGDWSAPAGSFNSLNPVHPMEHINCFSSFALTLLARAHGLEPARASLLDYYSFMRQSGAVDWTTPKMVAKSFLRPFYNLASTQNIYMWFVKTT